MLGKVEIRTPPGSRPRDGRHCDLCGCSQPAVRCDKCGCQIFCLSCDDMYHRHPKRRFHLRKAVDPTPPIPQARPVLPVKVAHLNSASPGDPSKMPLPPPRKKKSLFGSFRKPSPTSDNSPPLPKKEYSWSDRLGSIKKFMSNRPLPPLPTSDDNDDQSQPTTNGQSPRGDLSFIHRRSDERPPQLPQRSPKSPDFPGISQEKENRIPSSPPHMPGQFRNGSLETNANHINQNREFPSNEEIQWNNIMNNQNGTQKFGTLNRQSHQRGFVPPGVPGYPGGMHQSSSATDLHNLQNAEGMPGSGQVPQHFPHYPMNPHMPPHYPYPMYPQFPNYPQYFGNSFANLSNPPTSEGDFSDQSEPNSRHSSKKYPFRKRAKRSQSVMMDRMAYPGQFYPFGPYPGYGPWGAPVPMEAPPSPASSVRSLSRSGRIRRRKKMTSEEDDEEFSVSSSPLSRPKSSSSDPKDPVRAPLATQTSSSEDESEGEAHNRRNKRNTIQRRQSDPKSKPPVSESKRIAKLQKSSSKQSDSDIQEIPEIQTERRPSRDSNEEQPVRQQPSASTGAPDTWECKHCTFENPAGNRICQVCCKTATYRTETPVPTQSSPAANSRKQSVDSEKGYSSPDKPPENEEDSTKREKQDMASLNSALDEAEKQISKGLEELMKLKDDIDANMKEKSKAADDQTESASEGTSKPVYKSSGRMRASILDKLNLNKPQTSNASVSTSTEAQTGQSNWTSDKIIEARRHSNSSTTSETYNSPIAQSPELDRGFLANRQKRDSSCQTQQDSIAEYLERKKAAEEAFQGRPVNNFGFGYGDRMDMVTSPVPSMYDRFFGGGYGMMQRSHSRASLFTGRMNDLGPMDYGGGFGYGPAPMYRSVSRSSLTGEYPDGRMSEFHNLRKPDFYLSMEELVERRRQENIRAQGLELVRMIREAEQQGFNADDIQVALTHCGKQNPMEWLQENWRNMVDSVVTLSTNYGNDKKENDIGLLSESEARDALRLHRGNIWAAVTECVEGRQRKYLELSARGNFSRKDIVDALTSSDGDVEMAYANLSKSTGKPFLMRIWGAGEGAQNQDGARPLPEDLSDLQQDLQQRFLKDETLNSDDLSEEIWSEDGDWDDDDEEYGEERGDIEDLQTCHEDLHAGPQEMRTPESDKSDYCDAFPVDDRNASSPSDDIFFVIPEAKPEKKKGFLSKLAALRKESKEQAGAFSNIGKTELATERSVQSKEDSTSQNSASSSEQPKNNGTLSALKNTLSAIKDTVTGGIKNDKKLPCAQPERRTIIVSGQIEHESFSNDSKDYVKLNSIKPLESDSLPTLVHEKESAKKDTPIHEKESTKNVTPIPEKESTKNDTSIPGEEYTTKVSPISERGSTKKDTPMFESQSKEAIKQLGVSIEKEEIKHNDLETKPLKGDQKDNVQSDRDNASKVIESKNKVGIKRQQSLAERLKFAKLSRPVTNASNSSVVQTESTGSDVRVEGKVASKINKEKFSLEHENTTSSHDEEKREKKLESETIRQIPENVHLSTERGTKLENTKSDVTQSTKLPELQNVTKEIKAQSEIVSSDPVKSVEKSPDTSSISMPNETKQANIIEPSVSETLLEKYEDSSKVKSVNEIKDLDTSSKTKKEQIPAKKEEGDKVLGNMLGKAHSSPIEKTAEVQKQISSTSADGDSNRNINKSQQSEIKKSIIEGKPDAFKDISSSSAEKLAPEIKPISSNSRKPENTVKEEKQIASTSTASEKVITALDQRDLKMNENAVAEIVKISGEAGKSVNEIFKNNVDSTTIESDIPNTVMEHTNGAVSETLLNKPSESKPESSVSTSREENIKSQQNLTVAENEVSNTNQNSTENADHSNAEYVEGTSSSSKDGVAIFSESNSKLDTGNLENHAIVTEAGSTINQTETTQKLQEGKQEQILIDKSQNISPRAQVNISQGVSINRLVEQESNLPTGTSVQNSLETKVEESSRVNSNVQQESKNITLEERITPKTLEVQVPSENNEEQNLPNAVNETSTSNNKSDSIPGNEVTVTKNDAKSIPNAEATPQSSAKVEDTTLNHTAVVSSVKKNDSSTASTSENTKIGKFKFSKSGKVKKTQAKDDKKDPKSQINNKDQTEAGTSFNKTTATENDSKASKSRDEVETKINSSSSLVITDELIANKVLTEKAAEIGKIGEGSSEVESKILPSERDEAPLEDNKKQLSENENESSKEPDSGVSPKPINNSAVITEPESSTRVVVSDAASTSKDELKSDKMREVSKTPEAGRIVAGSSETSSNSAVDAEKTPLPEVELQEPVVSKEFPGNKSSLLNDTPSTSSTNVPSISNIPAASGVHATVAEGEEKDSNVSAAPMKIEQHSNTQGSIITDTSASASDRTSSPDSSIFPSKSNSEMRTVNEDHKTSNAPDSDISDIEYSDESRPSSVTPPSPVDALRNRFEVLAGGTSVRGQTRPQSPFRRMSLNSRKQVIALEKKRDTTEKPWFHPKIVNEPVKTTYPKRSIKQQLEMERRVRQMVSDRKCRTYRKAEVVVQLMDMKFEEDEAIQAANECSTLEQAISYLQQECLLCAGHFPVSQIVSMTHCEHRACRECIRAYFTVQIRDRTILDLLCPFCNEPDIGDEDVAQDYFNHLDIMLKKLVDMEIHELFQRKLRDRVLMRDPNFRWCSQCSSGFIAMPNLKRLVCPDCNAVTCASCRRVWERDHQGISCEAFAALKDASDPEVQAAGLAKMLTEDGIDCPSCHFRYALAKGGCMHFRCIQCQHDFCSGCSRPFKMGQKCGVSEFCAKLGLHAHHPRNCLFYLRDKEPEDLQKLLDLSDVKYNREAPDGVELKSTCQVMEQKETADGMVDDFCGKEVQDGYAGLCRLHYVEYLGQLVNKHKVDPIQIFENDDLELVLRRANIRLPPKRYRESEIQYREKLVNLIQEELPLDKMDGS